MYVLQAAGKISESYLNDVFYLLIGIALCICNKTFQNCISVQTSFFSFEFIGEFFSFNVSLQLDFIELGIFEDIQILLFRYRI